VIAPAECIAVVNDSAPSKIAFPRFPKVLEIELFKLSIAS